MSQEAAAGGVQKKSQIKIVQNSLKMMENVQETPGGHDRLGVSCGCAKFTFCGSVSGDD